MDINKLKKLKDIKYSFSNICALCTYSKFPNNNWGFCNRNFYVHKKHKNIRNLSVHKFGSCESFVRGLNAEIETFEKLLKN